MKPPTCASNPRLPWVGTSAFSHKGGTHANAGPEGAEQLRARRPGIGRQRATCADQRYLAGRSNIVMKARELGRFIEDTPRI